MATTNVNRLQYGGTAAGIGVKQLHQPVNNSTFPIHQGDLVYLDQTAHLLKPLDSDAHAATFVGVAAQPSVVSSNLDNGTIPAEPAVLSQWDGVFLMKTTAADTYHHGDPVYLGADAQTITNTVGGNTNILGYVAMPVSQIGSTITGATGVQVPVYLKSKLY